MTASPTISHSRPIPRPGCAGRPLPEERPLTKGDILFVELMSFVNNILAASTLIENKNI